MKPWKKNSVTSERASNECLPDNSFRFYARPILALLPAFICGILFARLLPGYKIAWFLLAATAIRSIYLLYRQRPAVFSPLILFAALGYLSLSPLVYPEFPPDQVLSYLDGNPHLLSATISTPPEKEGYRSTCILKGIKIIPENEKSEAICLPGRLRGVFYGGMPRIHAGDRIKVSAKFRPMNNFNNPGGFDYRQYMAYQRVWGSVYATGRTIDISPAISGNIVQKIFDIREKIDASIAEVNSGDTRAILSALLIGKKDWISTDLREAFSHAGASHLLAISGLHIGIVATCAFSLFTLLFRRLQFILRRAWVKKAYALLSFFPVVAYGMISGMAPPTQRAVIMVSFFLAALLFEREYNPLNTLATAAMAILTVSASSLLSISFQLSFAAVSTILFGFYLLPALGAGQKNTGVRITNRLVGFTAVSIFAILGTMPLVAYYFNQVSILGIFSNIVLIPLIGFVAIPLGLIAISVLPFCESLALSGFALCGRLIEWALKVVDHMGNISIGAFKTITPSVIEVICIYIFLICIPLFWHWKSFPDKKKGMTLTIGILIITSLIFTVDICYWVHRRHFNDELRITIIDVGQGNSAILECGNKTMIIDGGGFSDNSLFDVGGRIVAPYLWQNKIRTIDTVVLSHPDADHLNGLLYILEHFPTSKVISSGFPSSTNSYKRFLELIHDRKIPHMKMDDVQGGFEVNDVKFEIFYPDSRLDLTNEKLDTNNSSIILRAEYLGQSILFAGDIGVVAEKKAVERHGSNLASSFLLSPHHGSKTSSSPEFLDAVSPETVIISVRKGRFGLPSKQVIDRYMQRGYDIFQTDIHGAIRINIDDKGTHIQPTLPGAASSQ